jgi:hypothetical protein
VISDLAVDPLTCADLAFSLDGSHDREYCLIMNNNETTVFFTSTSTEAEINAAADALILVACPSVARQSAETAVGRVVAEGKDLADLLDALETPTDDSDSVWA